MEIVAVIGIILGFAWVLWGTAEEQKDPVLQERRSRLNSHLTMHRRRYTNTVSDNAARTVKRSVSGKYGGLGNGGGTTTKP